MEKKQANKKKFFRSKLVEINTDEAKFVLKNFEYLSSALYFLYVKAPYFTTEDAHDGKKIKDFVLTEEALYSKYDYVGSRLIKTANKLSTEISRLNTMISEKDSELGSVSYSFTKSNQKIYAPIANNFLNVILELDKLVMLTDVLWFDGHISDKERNSNLKYYKSFISSNFQNIITITSGLKDSIYGKK